MKAKIRAIVKRPDEKYGHVTHVSNTLEALQQMVGGYIETVPIAYDTMIINEEGKLRGLEPNFRYGSDVIYGTMVMVGRDGEEFGDCVLGFDTWKKWLDEHGRLR